MNQTTIYGRVHKFGNNINTDLISPAKYMDQSMDVIISHAMEGVDPEFSKKVTKGDIIVAGENFGSGSSRETAPIAIKGIGVSVVIAESFARIFYRNSINIGLPVLVCKDSQDIKEGDQLEISISEGTIKNLTNNTIYQTDSLPDVIVNIVNHGGLLEDIAIRYKNIISNG